MDTRTTISLTAFGLVAFAAGIGIWKLGTMTSAAWRHAEKDAAEVTGTGPHEYFSTSYNTARMRFLEAAREAGANIDSVQNPHTGPSGEPLFMDVALFGGENAKRVLVVSSGTHGVEGFAGSGIQTGLLINGIGERLPAGTRLLMIHAINPYGMAHLRRANEDSVDLNRNFRDHTVPPRSNPPYKHLSAVIAPQSLSFWTEVASWSQLLWFQMRAGKKASQAVVSGGQYSYPDGLFYGGRFDTWSNQSVRSLLRRHLSDAAQVVFIDFHTGLGPFGSAEIILDVPEVSLEYHRALAIWGPSIVKTTVTGASVSIQLDASVKLAIPETLSKSEVTAVSVEFGTVPSMQVFKAMRAENWLHHYGSKDHPKAQEIKAEIMRVFYPSSDEWKQKIWQQGREIVYQALSSFR